MKVFQCRICCEQRPSQAGASVILATDPRVRVCLASDWVASLLTALVSLDGIAAVAIYRAIERDNRTIKSDERRVVNAMLAPRIHCTSIWCRVYCKSLNQVVLAIDRLDSLSLADLALTRTTTALEGERQGWTLIGLMLACP
jgi:hypothetical protein